MAVKMAEIVCILDRSGSMSGLVEETIAGFNGFLKEQRDAGPGKMTLVLFDDRYEIVYEDEPLSQAPDLNTDTYYTRGSTALLDAVGETIARVKERQMGKPPIDTLFLIITDGEENASIEYVGEGKVKAMVNDCINDLGWTFLYLGANVNAFHEAGKMGIPMAMAANYDPTKSGTHRMYGAASTATSLTRSGETLDSGGNTLSDLYDDAENDK